MFACGGGEGCCGGGLFQFCIPDICGYLLHSEAACIIMNEVHSRTALNWGGGGGGKALTMTMTLWNLIHGQWSKNLTMAAEILGSAPWSMVKMVILWSNLTFTFSTIGNMLFGHGQ